MSYAHGYKSIESGIVNLLKTLNKKLRLLWDNTKKKIYKQGFFCFLIHSISFKFLFGYPLSSA